MKASLRGQVVLCVAAVLLTSCASKPLEATKTPSPIIEVTTFPMSLKIDDINVEFSGHKRDNEYFTVDICFDPPSKENWMFDDVIFKIENQEIPLTSISSDSGTGRTDGFTCGSLSYPIDAIPTAGKAELSIGQLQTNVNSDERDCDKAQKKLDEAKTGIAVTCDLSAFGYASGFGILKKPSAMSDEEAHKLAKDAFSDTIQVNWRFSFPLEKP